MTLTKRQEDLFRISKGKLSRDMGRKLTEHEVEQLRDTIRTNFPTDKSVDKAFDTLASKMVADPEVWDDWMNKNYPVEPPEYRKKKTTKSKSKRKSVKKGCGCK